MRCFGAALLGHIENLFQSVPTAVKRQSGQGGGRRQAKIGCRALLATGVGLLSILGVLSSTAGAATIYVAATGADTNDGLSWGHPKKKVSAGLAAAISGDQVWVAAGTYVERITLKSGVALYGGFAGNEPADFDLSQRGFTIYPTILDGNKGGSVVTVPSGAVASTQIDGFTIRNGSTSNGGGVNCASSSKAAIANNVITANSASSYGGGIYCASSSNPAITDNTITGNSASTYGGGVFCSSSSNPTISSNTISSNKASGTTDCSGGGIYCQGASALITRNRIIGNTANSGFSSSGGGVSCVGASPVISNNTIAGNAAIGGSSGSAGGGICCSNSASAIFNNTVAGNSAGYGGGVFCSGATSPVISNNTIIVNSAGSGFAAGGGIHCTDSSPTISNNIVADNSSGLFRSGGTLTLSNNCVFNPSGDNYSGLSPGAGDISADPDLVAASFGITHLAASSPCVDAGRDAVVQVGWLDLDGEARVQGGHVDIGADEFNGTVPTPFMPVIVRVQPSGNDANDGSSWNLAKQTVQAGIDAAASAGGGDVWVAAGTYRQRITLKAWVHVYGGFAGNEENREQRNAIAQITILDGAAGGSVVNATSCGHASSTIDGFTIRNGSGTVFTTGITRGGGINCSCAITIANNRIIGNVASAGGGIFCGSSPVIANNVILGNAGSSYGGGISTAIFSSPTICSNTITGNHAATGGGIDCSGSASLIANNIVAFNSAGINSTNANLHLHNNCVYNPEGPNYSGLIAGAGDISVDPQLLAASYGELHLTAGSPCIDAGFDDIIPSGWLDMDGQPRVQNGHVDIGADEFNGTTPPFTPRMVRVSASGNDAADGLTWDSAKLTVQAAIDAAADAGGGEVWVISALYSERIVLRPFVYVYGGFAGQEDNREQRDWASHVTVLDGGGNGTVVTATSCGYNVSAIDGFTIRNGKGSDAGGGIHCSSAPSVAHNTITGNSSSFSSGGGVWCTGSASAVISNNTIKGNSGGIFCTSSARIFNNRILGNTSGGVYCSVASATIVNNTILGNTSSSGNGAGIYCSSASPTLSNNIVAFNSSGLYATGGGAPVLRNNCVYNPAGANYSGLTAGAGDISVDPVLSAAGLGEVHLLAGSPCIDAGVDAAVPAGSVDLDGEARIQGFQVDIGADEFNGTTPPFTPRIVRVTPSGSDTNDGSTWALARRTVQAGMDAAAAAGGGEVWVAAGTYTERINLLTWVHVYGGFAGNEDNRGQRDWVAHVTTLDGGAVGTVVTASSGGYALSTIDGFTIRNGSGTPSGTSRYGGGIYCSNSSPVISNNTITGNKASSGAGIYCNTSSPAISNNAIVGNNADSIGGGIYCFFHSSPAIYRNRIAGNTGTGVYCYDSSSPTIAYNTIVSNQAGSGGGLSCSLYCAPAVFSNVIAGNSASAGGGVYNEGGTPGITNNTIVGNSAGIGGGIDTFGSTTISNNIVAFNSSGIYKAAGTLTLRNNCVYNPDGANYVGVNAGSGDKNTDPGLVSPSFGEFRLRAGSVCTDAGLDAAVQPGWLDLDGEPRIQGMHADIGADEFNGVPPADTSLVILVRADGSDALDGSSWNQAKRTVQAGIDAAAAAGGGEVWVAAGLYHERITLRTWTYVYGGFAGLEISRGQRDWAAHTTTLDAGGAGSVVTATAPGYRTSAIDGFTIRGGRGTLDTYDDGHGGGVYCASSSPSIANNVITGNIITGAGGGVYCINSSSFPLIINNAITGNTAESYGGGMYCSSATVTVFNNTIADNTSQFGGGGVYCTSSSTVISNNKITGNQSTASANGTGGGGIYCNSAPANIFNNLISGNISSSGGGGIRCSGSNATIGNNTIAGNTAPGGTNGYGGGGIYCQGNSPIIANNIVAFNSTGIAGGSSTSATLRNNCVFNPDGANYTGLSAGTGDISLDPQFVSSPTEGGSGDIQLDQIQAGDYHVRAGSACIDVGYNAAVPAGPPTELDGHARLLNDPATPDCRWAPGSCGTAPIVDMGAYEFIAGDYDRDGDLDASDLNVFESCVSGPSVPYAGDCAKADLDHDGDVDLIDFGLFQRCYSGTGRLVDPGCGS